MKNFEIHLFRLYNISEKIPDVTPKLDFWSVRALFSTNIMAQLASCPVEGVKN